MFPIKLLSIRIFPALIISVFILAGLTEGSEKAPSWPGFHGPDRNNLSTETGLLKKWPEAGPELIWTAKGLGHGFSTVAISGGMIYTAGNIDHKTIITAMDMKGKHLWQAEDGKSWEKDHAGTRGTPTIDGDRLYYESPLGEVICLNAKTGKKIWELNIIEKYKSKIPTWALAESLLIDRSHVICCPGGPEACMIALDKDTGKVVWEAESINQRAGYASPVLAEVSGLRIIITLTAKAMIGVNADTGKLLWSEKHLSYADENVLTPVYKDGSVFVSSIIAGSVKWKINVKDGKVSLKELWRSKKLDNHHGGVILVNGFLYGASCFFNKNKWVCLDWKTGEMKYAEKGVGKGSLTYADGMLYTLSRKRKIGLVRATPDRYELVSSFDIPKGGKGYSWAHPVICGGRLYIRHDDFLYVYNVKASGK